MYTVSDLKNGLTFLYEGVPYAALEVTHKHVGRGGAVTTARIKNLLNGNVTTTNFRASDTFQEVELEKVPLKFLYAHRDVYWFSNPDKPGERFQLSRETLGENMNFLKPNSIVESHRLGDKTINIKLPIKMELEVKEAPPSIRGNTAQGGTKQVVLETGATVNAPLFVEQGDIVVVNTETGQYVERARKGK